MDINKQSLDNYITGRYGEDEFQDQITACQLCDKWFDYGEFESPDVVCRDCDLIVAAAQEIVEAYSPQLSEHQVWPIVKFIYKNLHPEVKK